jgi:hypothetical protein
VSDHYADAVDTTIHDEQAEADHDQQAADWAGEEDR